MQTQKLLLACGLMICLHGWWKTCMMKLIFPLHAVTGMLCLKNSAVTTSASLLFVNQEWFYAPKVTSASDYREVCWVLLAEAHYHQYNVRVLSDLRCYAAPPFSNLGHFGIIRPLRSVVKHQSPLVFETHVCCGWDGWQGMPRSNLGCRWQEILRLDWQKRSNSTLFWAILLFSQSSKYHLWSNHVFQATNWRWTFHSQTR